MISRAKAANKTSRAATYRSDTRAFKPRARLLLLLGDQLIRDPMIAVFELVKNAYDAYSPDVNVIMTSIDNPDVAEIVVEDRGSGMSYDTVTGVWLEPGTDFRVQQRRAQKGTLTRRLPLGEKGVGRFAAHKLGNHIRLITRKRNAPEVVVEIDWEKDFKGKKYLQDVPITVQERLPRHFKGNKHGTRIEITKLRSVWSRAMLRSLARAVNSICSPFEKKGDFKTKLVAKDQKEWLKGILDVKKVLKYSLFQAHCELRGKELSYTYFFTPYPGMERIEPRKSPHAGIAITAKSLETRKLETLDLDAHHIGPVDLDLYIFDREPQMLALSHTSDIKGLKDFLDESGGVRVYRDGIRVYDYGEPDDDWLWLDARRVNIPTARISNNLILGAVSLDLKSSVDLEAERGLIEKTNREGFVDNIDFRVFRSAIQFTLTQIQEERNQDKLRLRKLYNQARRTEPVLTDLSELRALAQRKKLIDEMGPYLDRIERDFLVIRDRFLTSASAGLNLSIVIHEVEKGIASLKAEVQKNKASPRVKTLALHLAELVEGFSALIRGSGISRVRASSMISQALFNTQLRLKIHGIQKTVDFKHSDFEVKGSRRLIISTLMNLIDNSIWWLDSKWGEAPNKKRLYIGTSKELSGGPAIIVADNGPGFIDPPEYLVEPFISRKPDGMGLGLHLADQVMKAQGGNLVFPDPEDVSLPEGLTGAVVALVFHSQRQMNKS